MFEWIKKNPYYLFPIIVVCVVGFVALLHRPFGSFDETNTIRIVSQPISDIFRILSEESNFPLFYVVLKVVRELLFRNEFLLQLLYFASYFLSGYLFYKIMSNFTQDQKKLSFILGIFYAIPALAYSAYYIRMYNFAILIGFSAILALVKFSQSKKQSSLYAAVVLFCVGMMLHPMGILWGLVIFAVAIDKEVTPKQRIILFAILFFGLSGWLAQLLIKTDLYRIFFVAGPKYMIENKNSFTDSGFLFYFYGIELKSRGAYELIGLPVLTAVIVELSCVYWWIVRRRSLTSMLDRVALASFATFFVTPLLFNSKIYVHHLHYLLPFGAFSIAYVYTVYENTLRSLISKQKELLIVAVITIFSILLWIATLHFTNEPATYICILLGALTGTFFIYANILRVRIIFVLQLFFLFIAGLFYVYLVSSSDGNRCAYIKEEAKDTNTYFLMQHNDANFYFNCLRSNDKIILMDENKPLFYAQNRPIKEILIEQAIRGGGLGTFDEIQKVFSDDSSLLRYNIKRLSIKIEGVDMCEYRPDEKRLIIKGYQFIKCGKAKEYIYEMSQ